MARHGVTLSIVKRWLRRVASAAVAASFFAAQAAVPALADGSGPLQFMSDRCAAQAPTPREELRNAWQLQRLQMDSVWTMATGKGVKVAVIDTGSSTAGSPYLSGGGRVRGYNMIPDVRAEDGTITYDCDHGTAVTSIIGAGRTESGQAVHGATNFSGIAPDAEIVTYRALKNSTQPEGEPSEEDKENLTYTIDAIRHATDVEKVDVINLSQATFNDAKLGQLQEAVLDAIAKGVVVVAAAGNQGQADSETASAFPAAIEGVIAVGMSNQQDSGDEMTHVGRYISIGAPGRNLVALAPSKPSQTPTADNQAFALEASGTSYAAPIVSGVVALMIEHNNNMGNPEDLTPARVRDILVRTADPSGVRPPDPFIGYGVVNPLKALTGTMGASPTPMAVETESTGKIRVAPDEGTPLSSMVGLGVAIGAVILVALGVVAAISIPAAVRRRATD